MEVIFRFSNTPIHWTTLGKINCWVFSQADLIQNHFLRKCVFRKQNFRNIFATTTLFLALFGPLYALFCPFVALLYAKTQFLALIDWIFSSHFLLLSPLPPTQIRGCHNLCYHVHCPAVTGFKLQTMVLDKCKPSQTKKTPFFELCLKWRVFFF